MSRKPTFIRLTPEEAKVVRKYMNEVFSQGGSRARRRVQAVVLSAEGKTVTEISRFLKTSKQSIWKWFKIYQEKGLEGLRGSPR